MAPTGAAALAPATSSDDDTKEEGEARDLAVLRRLGMHPDQLVPDDPDSFNRYKLLPFALANHLSLGAVFAWSILNAPLQNLCGVVAPAAADWVLGDIQITFSLIM